MSTRDFTLDYKELLKAAHAENAQARLDAEAELREAALTSGSMLSLDRHPRDDRMILLVRLAREGGESWLFGRLGQPSPTEERHQLAGLIDAAMNEKVPSDWKEAWQFWCAELKRKALEGGSVEPFKRDDPVLIRELLRVNARVLSWKGESLIRFASCTICGDSKQLEQWQSRIETALSQITQNRIRSLEDVGLIEKPRQVMLHGPLRLILPEAELDLSLLRGPVTISETDLDHAVTIHCAASHVLTVENETTFLELTKLQSGTLLIHTSFPGRAVLSLLAHLPAGISIHHFGDSDPAGFDILRDLRERSGRGIAPLHMKFRPGVGSPPLSRADAQILQRLLNSSLMADCHDALREMLEAGFKGTFEQESLGPPTLPGWPFYPRPI